MLGNTVEKSKKLYYNKKDRLKVIGEIKKKRQEHNYAGKHKENYKRRY